MKTSAEGLALIKKFEGCRLRAYQDSVGVWTIGVGHTKGVEKGDVITEEQADEYLRADLSEAEECVNRALTLPLTQGEFDACVSFVFNVGCGAFRGSTLLKRILDGDLDGARLELARWNKAGGQVLAGLTARRKAEAEMFENIG